MAHSSDNLYLDSPGTHFISLNYAVSLFMPHAISFDRQFSSYKRREKVARFPVNLHFNSPRTYLISHNYAVSQFMSQAISFVACEQAPKWGIGRRQKSGMDGTGRGGGGGGGEKEREAKLSTCTIAYLTNQSVIPESGISIWRHSKNVHRLFSFFLAHIPRSAPPASQVFFSPYTPLGNHAISFDLFVHQSMQNIRHTDKGSIRHCEIIRPRDKGEH